MTEVNGFDLQKLVGQFQIVAEFEEGHAWTKGHINDTYIVTCRQGGTPIRYILQRINHHVFPYPELVMQNVKQTTEHLRKKISQEDSLDLTRRTMTLVPARGGAPYYRDRDGNYWRTYVFIERVSSVHVAEESSQAGQVGRAFGLFQKRLADLSPEKVQETIPEFHNGRLRFNALEKAVNDDIEGRVAAAQSEIAFCQQHRSTVSLLLDAYQRGELPLRITHNDTKIENVLFDMESGEVVCIVDLDTVMPGLVHYDFGDMMRTLTSPAAEDECDLGKVTMRMEYFEALAEGYLAETGSFLTQSEQDHLAISGKVITLILGIRFLTDYLNGDNYFRVHRERQNLDRARVQFKLVESMMEQEEMMKSMIAELG
ncbi:MAG: aminoglycoside phosphotransferase family protein [Verrucomicrobiota bacterium]|nr:aminoglycoside phosphotransferase family protein [Verrucomicrobiota bacterium]